EVRGLGLLLGLVLDVPAKTVQAAALAEGVILGTSGDANVLRVMPPLVVQAADLDYLAGVLQTVLEQLPA
ncbi:MAG TPA: aminotransferase class III-fold pyridoxal phosphate-dependent enzyme, partial [Chloroflexia bacterium]|nr:aminotransferase class III-fold pyridoxal phosphate-dependent enzyme [Chloroflexia bacterium]